MGLENTFQVVNYAHIPADQRSIQFTPGGTATTFETTQDLEEGLLVPDVESDNESIEEELETLERSCHIEEQADHEEECDENIESGGRSWEESGSGGSGGGHCDSGNESDGGQGEGEEDIPEAHQSSRRGRTGDVVNMDPSILPGPPEFEFFEHPALPHERLLQLPDIISIDRSRPSDFFTLFFDEPELEVLAQNTNRYALSKDALDSHKRRWYDTSASELRVFLGLVLYMGVWQSPQYTDYWAKTYKWPQHGIGKYMSKFRFEQIKRYFHVSVPYESLPRSEWYQKVEPLSGNLSSKFQKFIIPASNIAVDEMMVRFTGKRSETSYN